METTQDPSPENETAPQTDTQPPPPPAVPPMSATPPLNALPAPRRLMREDGKISGVSGGLAAYFNLDPTLVRLGMVVGTLATGPALPIIYVAAWAIVPERETASGPQNFADVGPSGAVGAVVPADRFEPQNQ